MRTTIAVGAACAWLASAILSLAAAQSVAGVFGPTVNADNRELELRIGAAQDANDDWSTVSRLHYQRGLNDTFRLRGLVQFADPGDGPAEFKFFQAELLWQTVEQTQSGYSAAFRLDARIAEGDDGANRLGVNWVHQWKLGDGWQVRAIGLVSREVGSNARDGVNLAFRSGISRRMANGLKLGFEQYSSLGNTDSGLGGFDDQKHTAGPTISGPLNEHWGWYLGVQFGLSEAANDEDFKFRLTRRF